MWASTCLSPPLSARIGPDSTSLVDHQPPTTVGGRSLHRYYQTNPASKKFDELGITGLDSADLAAWANAKVLREVASGEIFGNARSERDYWKTVQKDGVPFRSVQKGYDWGTDDQGRLISDYSLSEFEGRLKTLEESLVLGLTPV
ncbi:prenyltransferase alpha subunit [Ceratocystis lukuohia]|uniref:Prenyltransferase alpha subunit n=1 Tax=Ceratocystis lukuohia TaxID=2019550 RepID=A0ABR4MHS8_9PEZI